MNKKKVIGIIIGIVIIIAICITVIFITKKQDLNENGKKYLEFLEERVDTFSETQQVGIYDLDFDGNDEMLFTDETRRGNVQYNYLNIFAIENNEIKRITDLENADMIFLAYVEDENKYYYMYTNSDNETYIIKSLHDIEKYDKKYTRCTDDLFKNAGTLNKNEIKESFTQIYLASKEQIKNFDFTKPYTGTANMQNNQSNGEKQKLGDVAKAGDYVNYMGSDTDWRVLTFLKNTINGEENRFVYLINSSYKVSKFESTSYEEILGYLEDTRYYKDNIFLDETLAVKATRTPDASIFRTALGESYSTVPDLFDVGVNINLSGEETVVLNNGTTNKFAYYENGSGKVIGKMEWSKNIRPCVQLLSSVVTSGKNDKGAWMISNSEQNGNVTSNTKARRRSSRR